MTKDRWTVLVADPAKDDFDQIVQWTLDQFGADQAAIYAETLNSSLAALSAGPRTPGARPRDDIGAGLFTLHVARNRHRGRHLILFRVVRADDRVLDVLRLLHDRMDIARHAPGMTPE